MGRAHVPTLYGISLLTTEVLAHLELLDSILVLLLLLSRLINTALGQHGAVVY